MGTHEPWTYLQAFGHGPVRIFDVHAYRAECMYESCDFIGPRRLTKEAAEADAIAHLEMCTDDEISSYERGVV
jgi:hypothetical protein